MWYKEALAVRRALIVFGLVVAALGVFNAWGAGDTGGIYMSQAVFAATLVTCMLALIVGASLGRERATLARSALLRPIAREAYAWTVFAVDVAALLVAYAVSLFLIAGTYELAHGLAAMDMRGITPMTLLILPFGAIVATYGITEVCGITSRGNATVTVAIGPVFIALWLGAAVYGWGVARLFQVLCLLNPLMYLATAFEHVELYAHPGTVGSLRNGVYDALPVSADTTILLAIALASLIVATLAWKRAEA